MSSNNESIGKTFFVVIGLCLICAIFVSTAAVGLRPMQNENKLLDAQKNILAAVGMLEGTDVKAQFEKHVQIRLVDLDTGDFVDQDPLTYDYRKMMKDPAGSISLDEKDDQAKIKTRAKIAPVYLAYAEGVASKNVTSLVLPVHGYGLWSTMHGFLALDKDGNTIKGLNYYEHGETPGLGAEIALPAFQDAFIGKHILNDAKEFVSIAVMKAGQTAENQDQIDAIAGGTITSKGVENMLLKSIGQYEAFFKQ